MDAPPGKAGSLLQSGLTSVYGDGGDFTLTSVRKLEKKLARRLGEGVERLGTIIKDLAKAQRKLDSRTCNLELKVIGQVKNGDTAVSKKKAVASKGHEVLTQSGKGTNSKKAGGKSSTTMLKNSNSVKSP